MVYKRKTHFAYSLWLKAYQSAYTDFNIKQVKRNFELKNSYIGS